MSLFISEKNARPCRWGIIGPGRIARKFASALPLAGNAILEAVASREAGKAGAFAAEYKAVRSYGSYEQLAGDPDIDAVYIATPHAFHMEQALLCLENGKAVLCEKPMALNQKQVQAMISVAESHQVFLMEAMWTRFMPLMEKVLALIREGRIGVIKHIRADFGFAAPFDPKGRLYDLNLGGGSLLDIGIYPLFLCLLLLGEPDEINASGHLAITGADESCGAILQYRNGAAAMLSCTFTCATSTTAEIVGTEGRLEIPTSWYKTHRLNLYRAGQEVETITLEAVSNGFEYQIREVIDCLDKGLTESLKMPHGFSLLMSSTMDRIRRQIGVRYPGE